jgi:hypothetical protein
MMAGHACGNDLVSSVVKTNTHVEVPTYIQHDRLDLLERREDRISAPK